MADQGNPDEADERADRRAEPLEELLSLPDDPVDAISEALSRTLPEDARSEQARIDHAAAFASGTLWPAAGLLLGGSVVSSLVSQEIQEADSFVALMLGTLAWSLGVAIIVYIALGGVRTSVPTALVLCFLVFTFSSFVAVALGQGALNNPDPCGLAGDGPGCDYRTGAFRYLGAAIETYGPLGVVIATGVGAWAGTAAQRALAEKV